MLDLARDGFRNVQAALSQGGTLRDKDGSAQGISKKRSPQSFPPLEINQGSPLAH